MSFAAILLSTVTLAVQEVAAVFRRPDPPRHRHHHRWRRDPDPMQVAIASWYSYGGVTEGACGSLLPNGVANRSLPCWTKLWMCATRCGIAVVDDRGPFVAGRDFDLSPGLATAIGFDLGAGVGPIRWRMA